MVLTGLRKGGLSRRPGLRSATPVPITISGCILYVRADLGITLNGGDVSQWDDQSGTNNHLSQAAESQQPLFVASDSNFNNQAAVSFDGNTHCVSRATYVGGSQSEPFSMFLVAKADAAGVEYFFDGGTAGERAAFWRNGTTNYRRFQTGTLEGINAPDSNPHIHSFRWQAGANDSHYVDGVLDRTQSAGDDTMNGLILGANNAETVFGQVTITEIAVYNRNLTDAEFNTLGQYADTRYSISYTDI